MNVFFKIVSRSWTCMLIAACITAVIVSPAWVADWTDEWGVGLYCLLVGPVLVGSLVATAPRFLRWLVS